MTIPELLAPAGGMNQLVAAIRFGADAVYLGLNRYGMRAHAANFDENTLPQAVKLCHERGVKVYLTLNIFAFDDDIEPMVSSARFACAAGVDALIMSDIGAIMAVKKAVPDAEIHMSTQMSTMNAPSALVWHGLGVKRIVLAREMSLAQIRTMRASLPDSCELEAFCHGAVCMAYSGRCALSQYMTGRSANRGDCAQACRWSYALVEEKRPGVYFPVEQTERGVRIFSAGDLNMIRHLPELCDAGLQSIKIEGRMKNEYYVSIVVGAYRRGLDAIRDGRWNDEIKESLAQELLNVSHRPYDTGFFFGPPQYPGGQDALTQGKELAARVISWRDGRAFIQAKRKITSGERLELLTPNGVSAFVLHDMRRDDGTPIEVCAVPDSAVSIALDIPCEAGDLLRGDNMNHRQAVQCSS